MILFALLQKYPFHKNLYSSALHAYYLTTIKN